MKKLFNFALAVFVSILCSCNYIDEVSIAGYKYELKDIQNKNKLTVTKYIIDPIDSTISFEKNGSTVNFIFNGSSYENGRYSVDRSRKIITLTFPDDKFEFTFSDNGGKLTGLFQFKNSESGYPPENGPYTFIYKLK